jgi:hypothetical protein
MSKQERSNVSQPYSNLGGFAKASKGRRKGGQKEDFLDVTALIRSLQRTEGNPDCFKKAVVYCDRLDCAWRHYCLEKNQPDDTEEIKRGKDRDPDQSL